jgi:hypothetical protein
VNPAVTCLQAKFEQIISRHGKVLRAGFAPGGPWWRGPSDIRPMIEFLSVMDAGQPMRVSVHDYADPEQGRDQRCLLCQGRSYLPRQTAVTAHRDRRDPA